MVVACTVHGCLAPLEREPRAFIRPRGHSFDLAQSGYVNLLQPQDQRSRSPGDSRAAVLARRALLASGFGAALQGELEGCLARLELPPRARVADLGCGEGTYLAALAARFDLEGYWVDLSSSAGV